MELRHVAVEEGAGDGPAPTDEPSVTDDSSSTDDPATDAEPTTGDRSGRRQADDRSGRLLADDVDVADTLRAQTKGLMFREDLPAGYAMVFPFDDPPFWIPDVLGMRRSIHMLFVKIPLDVIWLRDGEVVKVETLSPWTGHGVARADTVIELPAGAADDVAVGDRVVIDGAE